MLLQKSVVPAKETASMTPLVGAPPAVPNARLPNALAEKGPIAQKASPGNTVILLGGKKRKNPVTAVSKKTPSGADKVGVKKAKKAKTTKVTKSNDVKVKKKYLLKGV